MQLKPFDAGRYDKNLIVIRNPANGKQDLFTDEEFEIAKFLKENESESLLALLLPNIGIAKKAHIVLCLRVLGKLRRMQVVDYFSITGRKPLSDTATIELETSRTKLEFKVANSLAAFVFALGERALSWLGSFVLLMLVLGGAAASFLFFPFEQLGEGFSAVNYGAALAQIYLTAALALSARAILQAAFLRAGGRQASGYRLRVFFPLICLDCNKREVNMLGFGARIRMGVLGLLTPLALSALFTVPLLFGKMGMQEAFFGFAGCIWATFVLACPFFAADCADILHVLVVRNELKERIAKGLRSLFRDRRGLSREMIFGMGLSFIWLLGWLDCLRGFWDTIAAVVSTDYYLPHLDERRVGALALVGSLVILLVMPALFFLYCFFRDVFGSKRVGLSAPKIALRDSLSFEERIAALEKIPLFSYLNDQERLALLNEMQPAFFPNGQHLMKQGEVGREFFVLAKGRAHARFTDMKGRVYVLADLAEGDAFGEIALIDDVPRTASIVSDGGCLALVLNKAGFENFSRGLGSPDRVKSMIRLTSFFRRHPLFSKLGVRDQAQLIDTFRFESVTTGEEIYRGQESFYVVYSGKVRVDTPEDVDGLFLGADDCFGYADGMPARYIAQEGTGLLTVKRDEFHNLIWDKLVERPDLFV